MFSYLQFRQDFCCW